MAGKGSGFRGQGSVSSNPQSQFPNQPIVIIDTSPAAPPPLLSTFFAPGGWPFSYAASTVIVATAILIGWAWRMSNDYRVATVENSRELTAPGGQATAPAPELVGRITGTADCRWASAQSAPRNETVPLGRKYELVSGLMEIAYQSGAKVILQGPCTYEVDSLCGGYLSLGRLTARVGGAESKAANRKSQIPIPKFVVKTPTAVVTDLGTEFGVEVDKQGRTESHVFVGSVKIVRVDAQGDDRKAVTLGAGQTARCQEGGRIVIVPARTEEPGHFVRSLQPETKRIVEKFDGPRLGTALEQVPPGSYAIVRGAAVLQQPPASDGLEYRGYIRTVATDFCDRDFIFEATLRVDLAPAFQANESHYVYFGIGDGLPNKNFHNEVTCGLVLAFIVDSGRAVVRLCRPGSRFPQSSVDHDADNPNVAAATPWASLGPGRHRFRMTKSGRWVRFDIDADCKGQFHTDFDSPVIDLAATAPLLNATNSRLLVGTGICGTMTVRFEEISIVFTRSKREISSAVLAPEHRPPRRNQRVVMRQEGCVKRTGEEISQLTAPFTHLAETHGRSLDVSSDPQYDA